MNSLQRKSTAYHIRKRLSDTLRSQLDDHEYVTALDIVDRLVDTQLEEWQYCYVESYASFDTGVPAYLNKEWTDEQINKVVEDLTSSQGPPLENTISPEKRQHFEMAGGMDKYCEYQVEMFREACAYSFQNTLNEFCKELNIELSEEEELELANEIVDMTGLWNWYFATQSARENTDSPSEKVNQWVLTELQTQLPDILDSYTNEKITVSQIADTLKEFERNPEFSVNF